MYLLSFQSKKGKKADSDDELSDVVPRGRSGRQKKVIIYAVSDEESDGDY